MRRIGSAAALLFCFAACPTPWMCEDLTALAGPVVYKDVFVGSQSACGLSEDGTLYCWGGGGPLLGTVSVTEDCITFYNPYGGGAASTECSKRPVPVWADAAFVTMSFGSNHACALDEDGGIWCWGTNSQGELGVAPATGEDAYLNIAEAPHRVDELSDKYEFNSLSAGESVNCATTVDGLIVCFGGSNAITLSEGTYGAVVAEIRGEAKYRQVAVGSTHACALTTDGAAHCWGQNQHGQLGATTTETCAGGLACAKRPVLARDGRKYKSLEAAGLETCGLTEGNTVECWGGGAGPDLVAAADLELSGSGWCVVTPTGEAQCNAGSSVGNGSFSAPEKFKAVGLGFSTACGVTESGNVYCWGDNSACQHGTGTCGNDSSNRVEKVSDPYAY